MSLTAEHRALLLDAAITEEALAGSGIRSYDGGGYFPNVQGGGILFPWDDGLGHKTWQLKPDTPRLNENGQPIKYEFPKGARIPFHRLRDDISDLAPGETSRHSRVIIAEGTKQRHAVHSYAPADFAVYGMSGCYGFRDADLTVVEGREVFLMLDADLDTNLDVWTATQEHTKLLKRAGAVSVSYVFTNGQGKEGVDDVLAAMPHEKRADAMRRWLSRAEPRMPQKPRRKRAEASEADKAALKFFKSDRDRLVFQPADLATSIRETNPAAITAEGNIALYRNGVYEVNAWSLLSLVTSKLNNYYVPAHLKSVTDMLLGQLMAENAILPERMSEPLMNVPNGMVDLRTGEILPHDPSYMSHVQMAVEYDPKMPTPVYDAWLRSVLVPEGSKMSDAEYAALRQDLEEVSGTMLDPSRTPSMAMFLFGRSRTGKSTYLRLLKSVAGARHTSAVTLQALGKDTFAPANLYGMTLNVAADLSDEHVSDLSNFKMATGDDVIQGNRKYGAQFAFTNQAMFAFSANEVPTVAEASTAYMNRIKPFHFPNTFEGREDKTLEDRLHAELPGILAHWVAAYSKWLARGGYGPTHAETRRLFESKTDRVAMFIYNRCAITEAKEGATLEAPLTTGRRAFWKAFSEDAEAAGRSGMGEREFLDRARKVMGVVEVRTKGSKSRALNVVVKPVDRDDLWPDEPVADPVGTPEEPPAVAMPAPSFTEPKGDDMTEQPQEGPQTTVSQPDAECPVPEVTGTVSEPRKPIEDFSFEREWLAEGADLF